MAETQWYYSLGGQQLGPAGFDQLRQMKIAGQVAPQDLVWCEGMADWQPMGAVPEFAAIPAPSPPLYAQRSPYPSQAIGYQNAYVPPSEHAGLALTGMILGLVSLLFGGPLLAIPGAICGWMALKGMKRTGDIRNRGFALTAVWIGVIETALTVVLIAIFVAIAIAANH